MQQATSQGEPALLLSQASETLRDGVLTLTVGALNDLAARSGARRELMAVLDQRMAGKARPRAIVLQEQPKARSRSLPCDLDVSAPTLPDLCALFAALPVPVIVFVSSRLAGPGVDLALAADRIVASRDARLALSDLRFGLVPAAGASQRLPRRVGAAVALDLLLSGRSVTAEEALKIGLVDQIVTDPQGVALGLGAAGKPAAATPGLRIPGFADAVALARSRQAPGDLPARRLIIDAVEAAQLLSLEQGLVLEATLRSDVADSDAVAALAAAAHAARRARRLPRALAGQGVPPLTSIVFLGVAEPVPDLVFRCLCAGLNVTLVEEDKTAMSRALERVAARQDRDVAEARMSIDTRDADWARLSVLPGAEALPMGGQALVLAPVQGGPSAPPAAMTVRSAKAAVPILQLAAAGDDIGSAQLAGLLAVPSVAGAVVELHLAEAASIAPGDLAIVQMLRRIGLDPVIVASGKRAAAKVGLGATLMQAGTAALARLAARGVPAERLAEALAAQGAAMPDLPAASIDPRANEGKPLAMPKAEIVSRWWSAMAAAGLDALASGAALSPSVIDHVLIEGQGVPARLGGPMFLADRRGLLLLRQDLRLWSRDDRLWAPPPILDVLIREDHRLADLER